MVTAVCAVTAVINRIAESQHPDDLFPRCMGGVNQVIRTLCDIIPRSSFYRTPVLAVTNILHFQFLQHGQITACAKTLSPVSVHPHGSGRHARSHREKGKGQCQYSHLFHSNLSLTILIFHSKIIISWRYREVNAQISTNKYIIFRFFNFLW